MFLKKAVAPTVTPAEFEEFNPKVVFANAPAEVFRLPFIHDKPTGLFSTMRRFSRLTQAELGARIDRSRQYVQLLESNFDEGLGTLRTYKNLAAALGYEMVIAFIPKQYAAADPRLSEGVSA